MHATFFAFYINSMTFLLHPQKQLSLYLNLVNIRQLHVWQVWYLHVHSFPLYQ